MGNGMRWDSLDRQREIERCYVEGRGVLLGEGLVEPQYLMPERIS